MFVKPWLISLWNIIDPLYYSCTRLTYVKNDYRPNIFRVRLMRYKGRQVRLADGTVLHRGDLLLKIHLHNVMLLKELSAFESDVKKARAVYRLVEQSLPGLAHFVLNHEKYGQLKGIMGITMLNRGAGPLGFVKYPLQNPLFKMIKWLTLLPIHFLFSSQPFKHIKKHQPVYLFMSKEKLMQKAHDR